MRKVFNTSQWVAEVSEKKKEMDNLAFSLGDYGAEVEADENSNDAVSLRYVVKFLFLGNVVVTIGIILMDHQTDSDVVIETMTTLPVDKTCLGYGSKAIHNFLQWALQMGLNEVRVTQVSGIENENFWKNSGFSCQQGDNLCKDFVYPVRKSR